MPRKSKVLTSPNVNQILDWIDENKSSRWISRELKNQFGESIGHVAISNFRKKNITAEAIEIVDTELKKESKEKQKKKEKEVESKVSKLVQKKAEREVESAHQMEGVVGATARQYKGLLNVAENFEDDYYKARQEAADPESKTTWIDVAGISFKAVKLSHEIHEGSSMENSITEGFGELADAIKKSREIIQKG